MDDPTSVGRLRAVDTETRRSVSGPDTFGEEVANAVTHGVGAALTMVLLYLVSTLYHSLAHTSARPMFKVLDHAFIYVLIAGTYTPFMLVYLRGPWGWSMFGALWALAAAGVAFKVLYADRFRRASTLLYLAMGWLGVIAAKPLLGAVPSLALLWLLAGGAAYSLGTLFYVWRGQRYHHAIWHLFVLAGTGCHFVAIYGHFA